MAPVDLAEISFFELDRLFNESARQIQRKLRRKKRKNKLNPEKAAAEGDDVVRVISPSRSRTPTRRAKYTKVGAFGGFTGEFEKVEKCIIVSNIPPTADEKAVYVLFSKCGTVGDVHIHHNRNEVRTGIAIVEFQDDEASARACLMGPPLTLLHGSNLEVKRAAEQVVANAPAPPKKQVMTRSQFTQQVLSGIKAGIGEAAEGPNARKLHIKNLRPVVTEEDMRGIFKPFGEFEEFKMGTQECWITFQSNNDAQDAMGSMQGFQLVGQELQIQMQSVDVAPPPLFMPPPPPKETLEQQMGKDSDFGATGAGGAAGSAGRIELMQKLQSSHQQSGVPNIAGAGGPAPPLPAPGSGVAVPPPPPSAMPPTAKPGGPMARTLLLQNMFTPQGVDLGKDPKFYEEIREDTHEECSKFGKVLHVTVDPRGATGLIYVLYEVAQMRQAAELALNGRWFEGKKIMAAGIDDSIWQALAAQAAK